MKDDYSDHPPVKDDYGDIYFVLIIGIVSFVVILATVIFERL